MERSIEIKCNNCNKHLSDFEYSNSMIKIYICSDCAYDNGFISAYGLFTDKGWLHSMESLWIESPKYKIIELKGTNENGQSRK